MPSSYDLAHKVKYSIFRKLESYNHSHWYRNINRKMPHLNLFIVWYTVDAMNFGYIILPILFISLVQVAYAQSLSDSINNAVTNDIENTFDSIGSTTNNTSNSSSGNDTGSDSTTTTTTTSMSWPGNSNSTTTTMKTNSQ